MNARESGDKMHSGPNFTAVQSDSGMGGSHEAPEVDNGGNKGTLTKAELADLLFEKVGFNKREAKDMVESFFEEVRTALERGEGVKLSGFGNFQLRDKPQRPGRNPKTGEEIPITARRVVTFHASQKLKALVDKHYPADGQQQSQP
jgi:integration host factor subunit alpha